MVVADVNDAVWARALLMADSLERTAKNDSLCFVYGVFSQSDPRYLQYKDYLGSTLRTFPATATLRYFSAGTRRTEAVHIPAIGVLSVKRTRFCQDQTK